MIKFSRLILLSLLLGVTGTISCVTVSLEVPGLSVQKDQAGNKKRVAFQGDVFQVRATISGSGSTTSKVTVDGLDAFSVQGTSQSTSVQVVNGAMSSDIATIYDVIANKLGDYELGPAWVMDGGNKVVSNTINFTVVEPPADREKARKAMVGASQPEVFCEIYTEKKAYVVGEPIQLNLKIFSRGRVLGMELMEKPSFPGFVVKEVEKPQIAQQEVDGKQYNVHIKTFILTGLQPGEKKLNPIKLVYKYPIAGRKRRMGGVFDDFFGGFFDGPRVGRAGVQSNDIVLSINDLPEHDKQIDGVGYFSAFSGSVDKKQATVNEPILLRYELVGSGNLDQITDLSLLLADGMRSYKSKVELKQNLTTEFAEGKKIFEYVLQIATPGEVQIPAQLFTYYNPTTQEVEELMAPPLPITIAQSTEQQVAVAQKTEPGQHDEEPKAEQKPDHAVGGKDIHFIEEDAPFSKKAERSLPIWLLLVFVFLPLFLIKRSYLFGFGSWIMGYLVPRRTGAKALVKMEKQLEHILKHGDATQLYNFFLSCFAQMGDVELQQISESWISHYLSRDDWGPHKIDEFLTFLSECASLSYAAKAEDRRKNQAALFKRAKYWFLLLKK